MCFLPSPDPGPTMCCPGRNGARLDWVGLEEGGVLEFCKGGKAWEDAQLVLQGRSALEKRTQIVRGW